MGRYPPTSAGVVGVGDQLQLVQVVVQCRDAFFKTLAFADVGNNLGRLASSFHRISRKNLPVVEHALRESLSGSVTAKISSET